MGGGGGPGQDGSHKGHKARDAGHMGHMTHAYSMEMWRGASDLEAGLLDWQDREKIGGGECTQKGKLQKGKSQKGRRETESGDRCRDCIL